MLTKTTETAIKALLYMTSLGDDGRPVSPKRIAGQLMLSSTYLSKIMGQLVKASIVRSHKGTHGGVTIEKPLEEITLLSIVEACQGHILEDFCSSEMEGAPCGYHEAMFSLRQCVVGTLSKWTLAELSKARCDDAELAEKRHCRMFIDPALLGA